MVASDTALLELESEKVFSAPHARRSYFGPDSAFTAIYLSSRGNTFSGASWHEIAERNPSLLEAHLRRPGGLAEYARKPLLSREGANVTLHSAAGTVATGGDYGEEGFVHQALAPIPVIDGNRPVLGNWYIADQGPAGMGIRESSGPITDNLSRFVPHYFD